MNETPSPPDRRHGAAVQARAEEEKGGREQRKQSLTAHGNGNSPAEKYEHHAAAVPEIVIARNEK